MKKTILWAIDTSKAGATTTGAKNLVKWFKKRNFLTEAIHVLPLVQTKESSDPPTAIAGSLKTAAKKLNGYLTKIGVTGVNPTVLTVTSNTPLNKISEIETFADSEKAAMLMLSSHGRTGLARAFIGSFAENLLLNAKRPIMFLPKKLAGAPSKTNKILFATDFSSHSREAFHHLLPTAKFLDAEIIIYHVISTPPLSSSAALSTIPGGIADKYYVDLDRWAKSMSKRWFRIANKFGVPSRTIIVEGGTLRNIGNAILRTAEEEKVRIIAAASVSKSETTFILGSVARDLIRKSKLPLWICGPKCDRKSAKAIWSEAKIVKSPKTGRYMPAITLEGPFINASHRART